ERAGLGPAPEEVKALGDVAGQEVAVDGLEPGATCVLDALVGDVDGFLPATDEVEDRREVRADPEQGVRVLELLGRSLGFAQELDRTIRVAAPGGRDRERRRGVDLLRAGRRI